MSKLASDIIQEKQASFDNLAPKRLLWDQVEMLFHHQLADLTSQDAQTKVFDPKLSTLTIERSYRVMAQMGVGKVVGISTNDLGDAKLKNLLLEKYVIPNANAQFDMLTKFRMVDMYSNIYGNFFVMVDQDIKRNGYVGPDMWMLNMRDVFPQVGAISLPDSELIDIRTWRPFSFFEGLKAKDGYKNIPTILRKLKRMSDDKQNRSSDSVSKREEVMYPNGQASKNDDRPRGYFEVVTRFERDRWVDVVADLQEEFRDQDNPQDDGDLPIACKYSIPLIDDFMAMGDLERGASMQNFINANWNLYGDAVKMSIFPPIVINKDNVASMSSIKPIPAAIWIGKNAVNNVAAPVNLSPQGISTFNNVHQVANASLLNLFGTTDTAVTSQTDPGFGRTPEALKQQGARENTRDNADRFYMEQFINAVMKKMVNILHKRQSGSLTLRMFPDEMEQLAKQYPEIQNQYNEKTGKLKIKKGSDSNMYDYEIVSGSTYAQDQAAQQEFLKMLFETYMKAQGQDGKNVLVNLLNQDGYDFNFGELMKRIVSNSGIQDWDKILVELTKQEHGEHFVNDAIKQFEDVLKQVPQQNMNQVPPTPNGQPMPGQMPQQPMPQQGAFPAPGGMQFS